jgi:hypothetical protein
MLVDQIGGIPAYTIIKNELISLIGNLPPTALFNVAVFDQNDARAFSAELSDASDENIKKLKAWLGPLNSQNKKIGFATLPSKGTSLKFESMAPLYGGQRSWPKALSYGIQKHVDTIYWLGTTLNLDRISNAVPGSGNKTSAAVVSAEQQAAYAAAKVRYAAAQKRWAVVVAEAKKALQEENAQRAAKGQPMKVIPGRGDAEALVRTMLPKADMKSQPRPPQPPGRHNVGAHNCSTREMLAYINAMSTKYSQQDRLSATIGLKKKELSFNVIHFVPQSKKDDNSLAMLRAIAEQMNGDYLQIRGLRAIQSAATAAQ